MHVEINVRSLFFLLLLISFLYLAYIIWNAREPAPVIAIDQRDIFTYVMLAVEAGGHAITKIYNEGISNVKMKTGKFGKKELLTTADLLSNKLMLDSFKRLPLIKVISEENYNYPNIREEKYKLDWHQQWMRMQKIVSILPSRRILSDRIVVWIDPLDGTQEFTEMLTEYVTVMACITINGSPYFGVIFQPFKNQTIIGLVNFGILKFNESYNVELHDTLHYQNKDNIPKRIVISRTHSGSVKEFIQNAFGDEYRVDPVGGAGYKTMELIENKAELYIHTTSIKKWDICAGDAIIRSAGGALIDLTDGTSVDYGHGSEVVHEKGILMATKNSYSIYKKINTKIKH